MGQVVPLRDEPEKDPYALRKLGMGYIWVTPEGFTFEVDYIKRHHDELRGMLTINSRRASDGSAHVLEAGYNFTSLTTRKSVANHLRERIPDVDWARLLEQFSVGVSRRANDGEHGFMIGNRPEPERGDGEPAVEWVVDSFIPERAMTWWYGARASCKSQTAALLAVCLMSKNAIPFLDRYTVPKARVGILDFEDHDRNWEKFIQNIANGLGIPAPDIYYKHLTVPLVRNANTVARELDEEGVDFLIVDSFGRAAGPVGQYGTFEEVAINFAGIMGEIDKPSLIVDHVSQASRENTNRNADPIGSQYKLASARAGYEVRMDKRPGSSTATIGIFDRKHQMLQPIGLRATWGSSSLVFETIDLMETGSQLALDAGTAGDRLMWQLRRGRRTEQEVADSMAVTIRTVQALVRKGVALNKIVRYDDDTIGLSQEAVYSSGVPVVGEQGI